MLKNIIVCILIIVLFTSCQSKGGQIDSIWENLVHAKNIEQEDNRIAELHQFISKKHISFHIYFIDSKGNTKSIELKQETDTIKTITIEFDIGKDKKLIKKGWIPKEIENCYYLFLE
ncbi:hypothetical protein [Flavobacterium sp. 1355]|uniref:hypothetical protein n=1 Tax=Flavobacterium sp. 1355 TaxID=2806571 RepID=UPI001AE3F980|nr:hypothetical protein [Flavobacterium sp. 1355]MBP1223696.1 putative polyphosphate/ATP-dependent NAD kinase [Flavobacterium sp. 1355]